MKSVFSAATITMLFVLLSSPASAGGHSGLKEAMQDPKKMEAFMDARLDHRTGLEGKEAELGQSVAEVVQDFDGKLNLANASDEEFGHYILTAVKTMNHNQGYQHQFNDALVKLHLTAVSMAKDNDMYEELVANDVKTTRFMMERIGGAIKMTGRQDYALKAIFEQTSCMFHLIDDVEWTSPTSITYTSPFARVLEASQKVGIFEGLTEEEVHNNYIIPRYLAYADIMGVELDVSPLGANGKVTVSLINYTADAR
jgi:hypothetical protein